MRLAVSEPVAAPREKVFSAVADFDALTGRLAGGTFRLVRLPPEDCGAHEWAWNAEVELYGVLRRGHARVTDLRPPQGYVVEGMLDAVAATLAVEVADETAARGDAFSRLDVTVSAAPRGIAGRVLVQPLRMMQSGLRDRLAQRLARLAREIEAAASPRG